MAPRKPDNSDQGDGGRSRSNSGSKRGGSSGAPKDSDDYRKRRERNNIAVRKSRQLSRQKAKTTETKVSQLREENKSLEQKVKLLTKELGVLKDLFLSSGTMATDAGSSHTAHGNLSMKEEQILNEVNAVSTDHEYSSLG